MFWGKKELYEVAKEKAILLHYRSRERSRDSVVGTPTG
jgi:hypothetical protein